MLDGSAKAVKTADRLRDPWLYSEISSGVPIWRWALALAWHSLLPRFAAALAITLWFHYLLSLPLTTPQRVISLLSALLLWDTISHSLRAQSRFAKNVLRVIALVLLPMYGVPVVVGLQGLGLLFLLQYIATATHNFYARHWIYVVSFALDPIWYPNPILTYIGLLPLAALTGALLAYGLFVPVGAMADWLLSFPAVHGALGGGQSIKGTADQSPLIGALVVGFISGYRANTHFVKLFRFDRPPSIEPLHLPRAAMTERQFSVAHVSDIHLTGGEPTVEGHSSPDPNFELICASPRLVHSDLIIVTGDATDAGLPGEWAKFFDCLPESALSKTVLVPGNHDVNIVSKHWARIEDADSISRSQRLVRAMSALDKVQGQHAWLLGPDDSCIRLRDFLAPHAARINAFMESKPALRAGRSTRNKSKEPRSFDAGLNSARDDDLIHTLWRLMFPMVIDRPDAPAVVVAVDTNTFANNLAVNAFGCVGLNDPRAFERFKSLIGQFENRPTIYALHHHLVRPPQVRHLSPYERIKARGMVLGNAVEVYEALRDIARKSTVIFHGHHHIRYLAKIGPKIEVVGAPSSGCGDQSSSTGPGFCRYQISELDGNVSVFSEEHIPAGT